MPRAFVAASLGIALHGAGSIAVIAWATRDGAPAGMVSLVPAVDAPRPDSALERVAAAARLPFPAPPRAAEPSAISVAPTPRSAAEAMIVERVDPPVALPPDDASRPVRKERALLEGTPPATRRALRSFRLEMKAGLAALQERVARCAAADASFTLDVETFPGGIRIVEAQLQARGSASDVGVACARSTLLGETIAAPSAEPGRQWRMPFAAGSTT